MGVSGKQMANRRASEAVSGVLEPLEASEVSEVPDHPEHASAASQADTVLPMARRPGRPPGLKKTGGRRKGVKNRITREIKELALPYGRRAFTRLAKLLKSDDEKVSLAAAVAILDRGFGRPQAYTELTGPGGGPIKINDDTPQGRIEVARRICFKLSLGGYVPALTDGDTDTTNTTDDDESPPRGPPEDQSRHEHEACSKISESAFSDPENFSENSKPILLVNDPPSNGMTRTYGTGDFSIRCDGPQRPDLPLMFSLIKQDGSVDKQAGWEIVLKRLHRLIGDDLPSFQDTETRLEVGEFPRRDERPFKPGRPVVSRRRRFK